MFSDLITTFPHALYKNTKKYVLEVIQLSHSQLSKHCFWRIAPLLIPSGHRVNKNPPASKAQREAVLLRRLPPPRPPRDGTPAVRGQRRSHFALTFQLHLKRMVMLGSLHSIIIPGEPKYG